MIIHRTEALTGDDPTNRLIRVMGRDRTGVATDGRQAAVHVARLEPGAEVVHRVAAGRAVFVYLADGAASLDREDLSIGDVAAVTDQRELVLRAWQACQVVVVDFATVPRDDREPTDDRR